jgi:hydroxymethylbilane synthase
MNRLRIATRESPLALWQTRHVAGRLATLYPDLQIELVPMSTRGDRILDQPLAQIGGKGLFLKELEQAMLAGEADLAVHSCKDMPALLEPEFALCGLLERADPADALVSPRFGSLAELPQGARVGTSSLRRRAQLLALRPDLQILDLRGNVGTRMRKLEEGQYDAIVLAAAGLQRLDEGARICERLAPPEFLPAPAQGVIALECRHGDDRLIDLLRPLHDAASAACALAERAFSRALAGSCEVPLAAYARLRGDRLQLSGLVARADGSEVLRDEIEGPSDQAEALGLALAHKLIEAGAERILGRAE